MTQTAPGIRRPAQDAAPLVPDSELGSRTAFVGGKFHNSASGQTRPVVNPATGATIATVPECTSHDVDIAVAAAKTAAASSWGMLPPKDRAKVLLRIARQLAEHEGLLARLESVDSGKPLGVSREDVGLLIDVLEFMAGAVRNPTAPGTAEYLEGHTSSLVREPLGVIGAITPWNFPLLTAIWKLAPLLATGNTCVLKPSEHTPLTTLKFAELTADLLPPGVLNIVTGDGPVVGQAMATHLDIALISLTGSVASGQAVARSAAQSLKRVHLELGGKAPALVFADADLEQTVEGIRFAGYWNSGQECGAACRVLVHSDIYDEFLARLRPAVESLVVGDPAAGDDVEVGPMVSEQHAARVTGFLDRAVAAGASRHSRVGEPGPGFFVAPSVVENVTQESEFVQEEVFGPAVSVQRFDTEEQAVAMANDSRYGLAASVWTTDTARAARLPRLLDAGTVWVNSHLMLAAEMPWAGFKLSGYGRDMSALALDDYSRTKHVMVNKS